MWRASYERHIMDSAYLTGYRAYEAQQLSKMLEFESERFLPAWLVYQWWTFCFVLSPYSVKWVSLYREEDGVLYLCSQRRMTQNPDQVRAMRHRRRWKN